MSKWFPAAQYLQAKHYAIEEARSRTAAFGHACDSGIEKFAEYGKPGFLVHSLPKPENRQGFELRCEIARASDPLPAINGEA